MLGEEPAVLRIVGPRHETSFVPSWRSSSLSEEEANPSPLQAGLLVILKATLPGCLADAEQRLGLFPGNMLAARIFLQGLVGVRPRPEPGEVLLRVQDLNF